MMLSRGCAVLAEVIRRCHGMDTCRQHQSPEIANFVANDFSILGLVPKIESVKLGGHGSWQVADLRFLTKSCTDFRLGWVQATPAHRSSEFCSECLLHTRFSPQNSVHRIEQTLLVAGRDVAVLDQTPYRFQGWGVQITTRPRRSEFAANAISILELVPRIKSRRLVVYRSWQVAGS